MTHICVCNVTIIGSDNGLSPGRRQAIIWTNVGILLIGPLGLNSNEIFNRNRIFFIWKYLLENGNFWSWPQCVNSEYCNICDGYGAKRFCYVPHVNMCVSHIVLKHSMTNDYIPQVMIFSKWNFMLVTPFGMYDYDTCNKNPHISIHLLLDAIPPRFRNPFVKVCHSNFVRHNRNSDGICHVNILKL